LVKSQTVLNRQTPSCKESGGFEVRGQTVLNRQTPICKESDGFEPSDP